MADVQYPQAVAPNQNVGEDQPVVAEQAEAPNPPAANILEQQADTPPTEESELEVFL